MARAQENTQDAPYESRAKSNARRALHRASQCNKERLHELERPILFTKIDAEIPPLRQNVLF